MEKKEYFQKLHNHTKKYYSANTKHLLIFFRQIKHIYYFIVVMSTYNNNKISFKLSRLVGPSILNISQNEINIFGYQNINKH